MSAPCHASPSSPCSSREWRMLALAPTTCRAASPGRRRARWSPPSKACEAKLDELGVTWEPAKAKGHVVDPVIIPDGQIGGIAYVALYAKSPPVMDCQLAARARDDRAAALRARRARDSRRQHVSVEQGARRRQDEEHAVAPRARPRDGRRVVRRRLRPRGRGQARLQGRRRPRCSRSSARSTTAGRFASCSRRRTIRSRTRITSTSKRTPTYDASTTTGRAANCNPVAGACA